MTLKRVSRKTWSFSRGKVSKNQTSDLTLSDFPIVGSCTSFNYRVRNPVEALPGFEGPASAYPLLALWLLSGRQKRFILWSVVVRKEQGIERSEKQQNKNKKQERDTQKKRSLEERRTRRVLRREREDIKDVRCGAEEGNPGGVQVCNIRRNTHCHDVYVR